MQTIAQPENDGVAFSVSTIEGSGTSRGTVTVTGPVDRERESRYLFIIRVSHTSSIFSTLCIHYLSRLQNEMYY